MIIVGAFCLTFLIFCNAEEDFTTTTELEGDADELNTNTLLQNINKFKYKKCEK